MSQPPAPASCGLETKFMALSALEEAGAEGRLRGYASRFGEPDQAGDIVRAGAFGASLARLEAQGRRVRMLWQHDPASPIGVWESVREDAAGLIVEGRLLPQVARGAEAIALMQAGALDGLSIGYRTLRAEPSRETGGRLLTEIELWEVSLVTFPLLPTARASLRRERPVPTTDRFDAALAAALSSGSGGH